MTDDSGSKAESSPASEIVCKSCHAPTGWHYIQVGNEVWADLGPVIVDQIHGKCKKCGAEIYFTPSQKHMERIIERQRKHREGKNYWE